MAETELLKKDMFGEIRQSVHGQEIVIERDVRPASPGLRWIARRMLRREAAALAALEGIEGIPELISAERDSLTRGYLSGAPMHEAKPRDPGFYAAAFRLLRHMHRLGVVHNDLAKEPNILVRADGTPAFVDFQVAWFAPQRGRLFRALAREDIRHLLKHKRSYCSQHLTRRERRILDNPSLLSRTWMQTVKPVYLFITRRLLGWADREGAQDRGAQR